MIETESGPVFYQMDQKWDGTGISGADPGK
jgi:hypothetical protein